MNVSCRWLAEYVQADLGPRELADVLTRIGLNVDGVTDLADGDACLLVEVTSNRSDCLGHIGVAREVAAALRLPLRLPDVALDELPDAVDAFTRVAVAEPDLCPLYTARIVRGVRVGPSPAWLAGRLEAVGVRPVNSIVDVTNYVMMECGQPLHAFDHGHLADGRIVVRRAAEGEKFVAIDHSERALSRDRLVIADARRPVALAGVMGGVDTEISDATTDVLLEAAVFDPVSIRSTARTLAMMSESSYRFERRVDPHGTDWAGRRACQLIQEVAGGRAARGAAVAGKPLPPLVEVQMRVARIAAVLGLAIPADAAAGILRRLGFEVLGETADAIRVRVPSWRRADVTREADLIEEVARHHGYDRIPESPSIPVTYAPPTRAERVRDLAGRVLTAAGYFEAATFSFTTADHAARFAPPGAPREPLVCRGTSLALRESVVPGLLESLARNRNVGEADARLFEIAHRFLPRPGQDLPQENTMLALASGDAFGDVKGVLEALFGALGLGGRAAFVRTDRYGDLDAAQAAEVRLDGEPLGFLGRASGKAARAFGLDEPPLVAEVLFDRLIEVADLAPTYRPLPQFPAIVRDLALVVDEAVAWADLERAVAGAGVAELVGTEALSVYRGKQVPEGKKSVALRLRLRSDAGTLTREQADAMTAHVLESLTSAVGAVLRT